MPKMVSELSQGKSFSRSADGGGLADTATRTWKILMNSPGEGFDLSQAIGVRIGDILSSFNPIPCVSIDVKADGESRLVRIVTAQYRSSPSATPNAPDPKTQPPQVRPALYSMSTSLTEIAAWGGAVVTGSSSGAWSPALNPVGDLVDGITRLEPVVTINIEQYSSSDMSQMLAYCGYVNSDAFSFSSLAVGQHCCMLQSISTNPVVEQFGDITFRGFKITFGFAVRAHWTITRNGFKAIGWDVAVPQTGFNIKNTGLDRADVDTRVLVLEQKYGKVAKPAALASGTSGFRVRAQVTVPAGEKSTDDTFGYAQRPAAQPVALNDDGTPRNPDNFGVAQKVLINQICIQPEMAFGNNFSNFGIRWYS
jgi:hypothetical protein